MARIDWDNRGARYSAWDKIMDERRQDQRELDKARLLDRLDKLKHRLRAWVHELDSEGPMASMAPGIIVGLQREIWDLEASHADRN